MLGTHSTMAAVQLSTGLLAKAAKEETQGEATLKVHMLLLSTKGWLSA